jgi:hypothetical protein
MNKGAKAVVIIMLILILGYVVVGVYKKNSKNVDDENLNDNETKSEYTYYLTSGDNEITLISESGNEKTTFKYLFSDETGELYKIDIVEECQSSGDAQKYYDGVKSNDDMSQVYSDITLEDNIVIMTLKQEYVDYNKEFSKEDIYAIQEKIIEKQSAK